MGDDHGFLHFVSTVDGNVLFSYQIYQNRSISFKYLKFLPIKSEESLAFGAILSDGTIICISNLLLLNLENSSDIGSTMKQLKISKCKINMNNLSVQKSFLCLMDGKSVGVVLLDSNNDIYLSNVGVIESLSPNIELTSLSNLQSGTDISYVNCKLVILRSDNETIDCYEIMESMVTEKRNSFICEKKVEYIAFLDDSSSASNTNVYSVVLAANCAYYTYGVVANHCMLLESRHNINLSIPRNAINCQILIESGGNNEVKVYCVASILQKMYESLLHGMTVDHSAVVQSANTYGTTRHVVLLV